MRSVKLFLVLATVALYPLIADQLIILDEVMDKDEQKQTGIDRLNMRQKIALEDWLNKKFVLKKTHSEKESELSMSINIENGKRLQLSDNSVWEIAPHDVSTSSVWITPFPVKITSSNDPNYPCLITNTISGASVRARLVQGS